MAKEQVEQKKQEEIKKFNDFIFKIHGQWINESDFSDFTFEEIEKVGSADLQRTIYQEIDKREESKEQYDKFIELYLQLYYEPLVEEYDEIRYMTRNADQKLNKIVGSKKISSIKLKS